MAIYDDDDIFEEPRRRSSGGAGSWDIDEDPDERDLVPDERAMTRCTHCKKIIFHDSAKCPYCKEWQPQHPEGEGGTHPKPLWWWVTVLFCVAAVSGFGIYGILTLLHLWPWGI